MSFFKKIFNRTATSEHVQIDTDEWLQQFKEASKARSYDELHGLRIYILQDSFEILEAGKYKSCTGKSVTFEKGVHDVEENPKYVTSYDFTDVGFPDLKPMKERPFKKTKIIVRDADCVEETLNMLDFGMKPAVINMANAFTPGGGYLHGAGAQEENLFRRSNCHEFLDPNKNGFNPERYPIPLIGGHYVPGVTVFRGKESDGYPLLPEPKKIDVLTVAALSHPTLEFDEKLRQYFLSKKDAETTFKKICVLFEMAIDKKNDGIVLSAIGCGAFRNPPKQVAELFLTATKKYYGYFKQITYAIFGI